VKAECSFRRSSQPGERLVVESHVSRFGNSSFTISHVFRDASGEIAAEGVETRIWAKKAGDARSLKAVSIPDNVRRALGG
jgi:4-hydroxybenzoyl-CoA thioesterase